MAGWILNLDPIGGDPPPAPVTMTIEEALVAHLRSEVGAIVGARVYPKQLPQKPVYPAIVFHRISDQRDHHQEGSSELGTPRFQLDLFATTAKGAKALAEAVRQSLDGFAGIMGGAGGVDVYSCFIEDERAGNDSQLGLYWLELDAVIQWDEPAPELTSTPDEDEPDPGALTLEEAIYKRLRTTAGVANLVVTGGLARIYPDELPQKPVYPCLVYTRVGTERDHHQQGPSSLAMPRLQVRCHALSHKGAKDLAIAVRLALDGYQGTMGAEGGNRVYGVFLEDRRDDYDDDLKDYWFELDFLIMHQEATA